MANVIRRGVWVRYAGNDERRAAAWGDSVHRVERRRGDYASGYFPMVYGNGSIHCCRYAIPVDDLEIVNR